MTAPRALGFVLSSLAAISVGVGLLASVAPRAFYDEVPGIDGLPPYNQHLLPRVRAAYHTPCVTVRGTWLELDHTTEISLQAALKS